jgi:hypothetical protein
MSGSTILIRGVRQSSTGVGDASVAAAQSFRFRGPRNQGSSGDLTAAGATEQRSAAPRPLLLRFARTGSRTVAGRAIPFYATPELLLGAGRSAASVMLPTVNRVGRRLRRPAVSGAEPVGPAPAGPGRRRRSASATVLRGLPHRCRARPQLGDHRTRGRHSVWRRTSHPVDEGTKIWWDSGGVEVCGVSWLTLFRLLPVACVVVTKARGE